MSAQSLYEHLHTVRALLEVAPDDMQILTSCCDKRAIGTRGLNDCTCVVILGSSAILLAHIILFPGASQQYAQRDLNSESYDHHEGVLAGIVRAIEQRSGMFPVSATKAWGIFAFNKQDGFVRSVYQQVEKHLQVAGFNMKPAFYEEQAPVESSPPKGELVAFFNKSGDAELWLERRRLWPSIQADASPVMKSPDMSTTPVPADKTTPDTR